LPQRIHSSCLILTFIILTDYIRNYVL
jgi:hypothetical protein